MNHVRRRAAVPPERRPGAAPAGGTAPRRLALVLLSAMALLAAVRHAAADTTTDCFPDRVAAFIVGPVSSPPAFNTWEPGIVLGPPGNATPTTGSLAVMSLGRGGVITLEFTESEIVDGPGPDFIAFENPFFCTAPPLTDADPYSVFAEPGIVAVSADGVEFRTFPYDATALSQVVSQCTDKSLIQRLVGLMGITPSFTGNYTIPDDPLAFDTDGDGVPDGEEAASCRNPLSQVLDPYFLPVLGLEVLDPASTTLRWNFLGSGVLYDAIRGSTKALRSIGGLTDLGVVTCLENDSTDLTTRGLADTALPLPGESFFYLVRQSPAGAGLGYGLSSAHEPRLPASGDCR